MRMAGWGRVVALPAILLLALPGALSAGSNPEGDTRDKKCHCFRGRPMPQCDLFWLTEVGLLTVAGSHGARTDMSGQWQMTLDLGYMLNVGHRDALGASLAVITNYEGNADTYAALKPRYRRWLSRDFALEIGLGLGIHGRESDPEGLPLIAQLDLTFRDYFSVTLLAERFRWTESVWDNAAGRMIDGDSHTAMTFSAGVTAGSYPGVIAAGVALVVMILTIETGIEVH